MANFNEYFKELKRRNVFKAALAYVVMSWIILQVVSIVFPLLSIPNSISKAILIILFVGFPIWIIFAWVYEVTPDGIKKTVNVSREKSIVQDTGSKFNKLILGALVIAIILLAINTYGTYSRDDSNHETQNLAEGNEIGKDRSVAVLAFENMSSDKEQEYFSDGISEEILNFLAKNPDLEVISRTSSFSYKGKDVRVETIGKELGVNYVLEGSVRKSGSTLRITAQLIDTQTGNHMWSETYDREMDDIFKIQDEIAGEVTRNLEANILGIHIPAVDTEAYNKYLQAKSLYDFYTKESVEKAASLVDEALEIDSTYAPLWLLKAKSFVAQRGAFQIVSQEDASLLRQQAIELSEKAIDLNTNYAEAYAYVGMLKLDLNNIKAAKRELERAYKLQPNNAEVLRRLVSYPGIKSEEVVSILEKSRKLDPLEEVIYLSLSKGYFYNGEFNKGLKFMETYLSKSGGYKTAVEKEIHIELLAWTNRQDEAYHLLGKTQDEFTKDYYELMLAIKFDKSFKSNILSDYIQKYGEKYPYSIGQAYALLKNNEKSIEWIEKAIKIGSGEILEQIQKDPYLDNIRDEKRFKELLEMVDFPEPLDLDISKIKLKD